MTASIRIGMVLFWMLVAEQASAIVGGGSAAPETIGRAVVTVVGSRGNFCSGALVAPDLVLTAAHCVMAEATYKVVDYNTGSAPTLIDVQKLAVHPSFSLQTLLGHRATADIALLWLRSKPSGKAQVQLGLPQSPIQVGSRFTVVGVGVAVRGDGRSGGVVRAASLVATGQPGTLQIRLVDALTQGGREGLGACTGDSGAPVFEDRNGTSAVVGVVSWSTGANNSAGCGGLTGVTPLTLYRDWIVQTARSWGAKM